MEPDRNPPIRPALSGDAARIAEVFLAARGRMSYLPSLHTDEETRAWLADFVLPRTQVWVAEQSGAVAGFVGLDGQWLEHLYIDPLCQGGGIGTALLEHAKRERPGGMRLHVFAQNDGARRFYERHGFEPEPGSESTDNEEGLPDLTYRWK